MVRFPIVSKSPAWRWGPIQHPLLVTLSPWLKRPMRKADHIRIVIRLRMTGVVTSPYALMPYTGTTFPYVYERHTTCVISKTTGLLHDGPPCFGVLLNHPQGRLPQIVTLFRYK
jgi:hypothetical protein